MDKLRLFSIGPDTISAHSPEDAKTLLKEIVGYTDEDLEDEEITEIGDYEEITVTWVDGDFESSRRGVDYPECATVEFIATYLNPFGGSVPRFELDKVSLKDGHIRVRGQAYQWATLKRGFVCSSEY